MSSGLPVRFTGMVAAVLATTLVMRCKAKAAYTHCPLVDASARQRG
jgi:hypothetical protein